MVRVKAATVAALLAGVALISQQTRAQQAARRASSVQISKAGMDPERLARIPARMKEFVEKGTIAGAVMLVARHGQVALLEAVGYQDLESKKPMPTDAIFQIRSMTKSVTAAAIMILLEEGRLTLNDPVEKHLPEFRDQMMVDQREGEKVVTTKKPSRLITIRDLLTHTSGMPADREIPAEILEHAYVKRDKPLAEMVSLLAQQPLQLEPGTRFNYSDPGFTVLARIIEVVSGQAYQDFVDQRIFRSLGMKDSFYIVPPEKRDRVAPIYKLENGKLQKEDMERYLKPAKYVSGNGGIGLFSTAMDMFAFYQMVLNGGTYRGVRILSRASVELMTTGHTERQGTWRGAGYGLGWTVIRDPLGASRMLASIGSYGHGGARGTIGWIDPKRDLIGVFMIQQRVSPEEGTRLRNTFITMANAAVVDDEKAKPKKNDAGMDSGRLARIPIRMKEFVEKGTIAGAVMLVARHGQVALLESVGYQDLESKKPMRTDTIFSTRSMQKSITAVGIMILVEEGRLLLTDPVEKHLPEFRDQVVIDKADGDKVLTTKKPSRPITIRDLLAHTSGVPGGSYREPFKSWFDEFLKKRDKTLAEVVALYAREPLEFEPGTRYLYSDVGFMVLARIIEVASGQAYQDFLEERIFRPLGMRDSFYFVPPEKDGRIASAYRLENGHLTKVTVVAPVVKLDPSSPPAPLLRRGTKFVSGSGAWFSTATDVFAFDQMMLNGGTYKGRRILSRASVELMTTVHTGELYPTPGMGYGLGWNIIREPSAPPALALSSVGSYSHGGFLGNFHWIDPKRDLIGVFMIQRRSRPEERTRLRNTFMTMANAAVVDVEKAKPKKNDAGMDRERLARIPARMEAFVEEGKIAGAVTLVARHGEVALLEAVGYQDLESKKPMRADTIFNIYSMTKSLTAVGIMTLLEEGRVTLTDPVEKYLPEFREQMMVDQREGDKVVRTKKPSRPITIRDLLTHTSGMPGGSTDAIQRDKTAAENIAIFAKELLLEFEPGTKYMYSSWGFITLGRIIEVSSGKPYEEFLEQRILRPLGMKDTFYFPPPEKCTRVASVYDVEDGKLKKDQIDRCRKRRAYLSTSGGWLSTASDIFAFYQMMLNGGTYNGVRILSRASVEAMTTLHTGNLPGLVVPGAWPSPQVPRPLDFGYGLGWYIIRDPSASPGLTLASIGSYGHGGSGGTFAWVDPKRDLVGVFLIQRHFGLRPGHGPERLVFVAMANAAILD